MLFYKYQGTGNDFILVDNRNSQANKSKSRIQSLCNRKFGIGSDGIIFLEAHSDYDFVMDFYNPDASQSFCGNGSRCAVAFANFLGLINESCSFLAIDGPHKAKISSSYVEVLMGDVCNIEENAEFYYLDTGSPHYVAVESEIDDIDMVAYGSNVRYNKRFEAEGTNVNVIEKSSTGIRMRTYERGVENETLSCGTGVTASALVAMKKGWFEKELEVTTRGGDLKVRADKVNDAFRNIWLCGAATQVFKGEIHD